VPRTCGEQDDRRCHGAFLRLRRALARLQSDLRHLALGGVELTRLIAKARSAARDSLTLIRDKKAKERVAGFLLNVFERLQLRGVGGREIRLGMSRDDIANYLGLRSETVSRCFTELARRQLIRVRAKRVEILKTSELRNVFHAA